MDTDDEETNVMHLAWNETVSVEFFGGFARANRSKPASERAVVVTWWVTVVRLLNNNSACYVNRDLLLLIATLKARLVVYVVGDNKYKFVALALLSATRKIIIIGFDGVET